jgi:predicted ABC-type ATPase
MSTFFGTLFYVPFVNADVIAKEIFPDTTEKNSYLAAKITAEIRNKLLQEGRNFYFETTKLSDSHLAIGSNFL